MIKAFLIAAALLAAGATAAPAQPGGTTYPTHSIRFIVPFATGGGTDALARILADALGQRIGQTVLVENMGGAGGSIGFAYVAHAKPDGYTLVSATPSFTTNAYIQKNAGYDPAHDFTPIIQTTESPAVLVVLASSPIKTVQDLIDMAHARPGGLMFGSAGVGSFDHLSGALFEALAHVSLTHVPYRGAGPALVDLLGGVLQVMFENAPGILSEVKAGQVRAIAVGTAGNSTLLPDLPTIAQTVPGYESSSWFGVLAPAGTPRAIVDKLNAALNDILADPAMQKRLAGLGVERVGGTPEQFAAYLTGNLAAMKTVAKAANLTPQ